MSSLFTELKRRNVFRVGIAYVVTSWLLLQFADIVLENIVAPGWVMQVFMLALGLGFPLAVFFAWAFELTPEGLKKEKDVDRTQSIAPQTGRRLDYLIFAAMAVALAYFIWESRFSTDEIEPVIETQAQVTAAITDRSIAVIPFVSRGDDGDSSFAEGIHDDLLTQLAKISALKVISRTSVMQYKDTQKSIPQIADELGVANVLEGGVQKAGDRIRINMQLIDADTDKHLWAETYDRDLSVTSIFDIQSDIAHAVSKALQANLTSDEESRLSSLPTSSLAAYDAYSRGKLLLPERTTAALGLAEIAFREAIVLDSGYAEAYAGLADTLMLQADYSGLKISDYLAQTWPIIETALALDPLLGEAYIAKAAWFRANGDVALSQESFATGVSLSPGYAPGHQWFGNTLAHTGRLDQGIKELRIAHDLDPQSGIITSNLAENLHLGGQAAEGWALCNELVEQRPAYSRGHQCLWLLDWAEGRIAKAIRHNQRAQELDPGSPLFVLLHASMLEQLGLWDDGEAWLETQRAEMQKYAGFYSSLGGNYYATGRNVEALAAARQALQLDSRDFFALSLLAYLDLADEGDLGAFEALSMALPNLTRPLVELSNLEAEQALLLAALMMEAGQTEQANRIATAAEKTYRHMKTQLMPQFYAQALVLLDREAEAADALRQALNTEMLGPARWDVLLSPIFKSMRQNTDYQDLFSTIDSGLERQRELYLAERDTR